MSAFFIRFRISSDEQFRQLETVFAALQAAKQGNSFQAENDWLSFFDTKARSYFWFPNEEEAKDWEQRWLSTSIKQRFTAPSLKTPWDFYSMIEAFEDGDYELLACQRISDEVGCLEFEPFGFPFGGTECMKALIEAFGHRIIDVVDE
jgi:hypothetical protein